MTSIKVRKLLITSGVYHTPISERIGELYKNGKGFRDHRTENARMLRGKLLVPDFHQNRSDT